MTLHLKDVLHIEENLDKLVYIHILDYGDFDDQVYLGFWALISKYIQIFEFDVQ